jgi:hypothetical protein
MFGRLVRYAVKNLTILQGADLKIESSVTTSCTLVRLERVAPNNVLRALNSRSVALIVDPSTTAHDGKTKMLNPIDEHTRESLLVLPERRWSSAEAIKALADAMVLKGMPERTCSAKGSEFVAIEPEEMTG